MIMVPPVELRFVIYCLGDMNLTGSIKKLYQGTETIIYIDLGNMEVPLILPYYSSQYIYNILTIIKYLLLVDSKYKQRMQTYSDIQIFSGRQRAFYWFYLRSCVITNRCNSSEKSHNLNSVDYSIGIERKDSMRASGR